MTTFRVAATTSVSNAGCRFSFCKKCNVYAWVRIIALRPQHGDRVINSIGKRLIHVNQLSGNASPYNLYRVVRWISPKLSPFSTKVSSSQVRVDNVIAKLLWSLQSHFKSKLNFTAFSRFLINMVSGILYFLSYYA